ncbi:MAG: excinuclease ABC subunit UvrA [Flavobacteriales bacterium]|nr:excinuclease ABC subunit UvrA [Flavobacteriales bacterium]
MTLKKKDIRIKGARVHNLKGVDVTIPRNKLTVVTGLSGSGKSSLAFDTLYAEGQRRYVESLSSYARQFLGRLDKPDVDAIEGIAPAIAIEQKVISRNSRSTVGTTTEIYDYLKLLYARIGHTISPISGKEVKADTVSDVVDAVMDSDPATRVMVLVDKRPEEGRTWEEHLKLLVDQGYIRAQTEEGIIRIDEADNQHAYDTFHLIIDRFTAEDSEENRARIADSVSTGFFEGHGEIFLDIDKGAKVLQFSDKFEADGMQFERPSVHFFSFNNPVGACKVCEGFGSVIGIDPQLVIPDPSRSVFEDGVAAWKGEKMSEWKDELIRVADKFDFPIHRPIEDLEPEQYDVLWHGNKHFEGIDGFFRYVESKAYKIQYRVMLSRYRGKTTCPDCEGSRLRKDANYVKVGGKSITELVSMPVSRCAEFFENLELSELDQNIGERLLNEIRFRLRYLNEVGLGYLTLDRMSNTLSGGESQRINLATSLGSSLVGSMYILDEPSIGLHSHDTERLIGVMRSLRDLGNTVIVVEHDEDIIRQSDHIIDMGPEAGMNGGELVFTGGIEALTNGSNDSLTAQYINGKMRIEWPGMRRKWSRSLKIVGASEHNLKDVDVEIPLNVMVAVTGVSGSGKTTLIKDILYPALSRMKGAGAPYVGKYQSLDGAVDHIKQIEMVDQNPIGRSSRSNPATYVKAYDDIRALFASQKASDLSGFKAAHFSFNVPGGRCDVCEGEGEVHIGMQFMADITLPCDACKGKRFKEEILEVRFKDKSIADVLDMTVDEAVEFFNEAKGHASKVRDKILPLQEVGLGYVKLGQPSSTLSGGEAQRIKLAFFLSKKDNQEQTLFIFDEPTTGLHFHDVHKLLHALNALIEQGHSVIVIEHNLDMVKSADWVIDLGPGGGEAGGEVVYEGSPDDMVDSGTLTAKYLKEKREVDLSSAEL